MQFVIAKGCLLVPVGAPVTSVIHSTLPFHEFDIAQDEIVTYQHPNGEQHQFINLMNAAYDTEKWQAVTLREALMSLTAEEFQPAALAWQYAEFLKTHRFCGQCGARMYRVHWEMAMHCHSCQHRCYPRVSPCIIVAIYKDDKILLAKGFRHQKSGCYSTLAGFVESAESLEDAVHREVFEEVGVTIKHLEYFGSQAWPFPHSLMCGYIAQYDSGEICLDEKEIIDADFFDVDSLPKTPPKVSIAGHLIDETVRRIKSKV